jgi:hypothetical protein
MSSTDQTEPGRPVILAPFHGSRQTRARRILGRIALPSLILFCLLYGLLFALYGPFMPRLMPIPLLVLGAIGIWALPDTERAPTSSLEKLFFAFLVGLIVWPNYLAIALPGLPWITVLRLIGIPMAVVLLICVSVSKTFRSTIAEALKATPWLWKLLVAFAVIQLFAIAVSRQPFNSFQKVFASEVNWTALFFVSCYVFLKPGRAKLWAGLLCLTAIPIFAIAFREHAQSQLPWAGHIPSFLKVHDESVQRILSGAYREGGLYRVQSTFTTPLGLGEYAALTLPFILYFIAGPYRLLIRLAAAALVPICFQVVLMTDSRLGLIGCMLSVLLFVAFWGISLWRRDRRSIFGPAIVLAYPVMVLVTFGATLFIGRIRERVWGSGQYADSTTARSEMYETGIPMVLRHPQGFGAGMGGDALGFHNASGVLTIDTYYLLIALDYGIIGFFVYYGMVLSGAYYASRQLLTIRRPDSEYFLFVPLAISLLNYFLIKSVFSNDDNHPLVFMMLGMIVALCARAAKDKSLAEAQAPELASVSQAGGPRSLRRPAIHPEIT